MNKTLEQAIDRHRAGHLAEAAGLYRAVLAAKPNEPDALALLGVVLTASGDPVEAIGLIERAIRLDPKAALFRLHLGNALMAARRFKPAQDAFRQAIRRQPDMAQAHYNLGNALRQDGDLDGAADAYREALRHAPGSAEIRNNLAVLHGDREQWAEAIAETRGLLADHPSHAEGWINLCHFAEKAGAYEDSLAAGQKAVALAPQNASAWFGLGLAFNRLERHDEALRAYETAIGLRPDWPNAWDNLAQTLQFQGRLAEAEAAYRKTIEVAGQTIKGEATRAVTESEYGNRHFHLALVELLQGKYREGFARYRARFQEVEGLRRVDYGCGLWEGESLDGKKILIEDEQGHGDCLMFCRYLPRIKAMGARVALLVAPALAPLFAGWPGADEVIARGGSLVPDFDYHASIFDLPRVFGTTLDTIPADGAYLPVPQPLPAQDAEIAPDGDSRLRIGVVWAGRPTHKHDARRTIPFDVFADLFAETGARFFSLTRDIRPGDRGALARYPVVDLAPRLADFAVAARLVGQMDLIITCDTATAHLAGGMGKTVWTLLPFAPDWRWMTEREDSPWYPTMRLVRQHRAGDWADVIARAREDVRKLISQRPR